ncbi:hypothetical protein [Gordonia sihwensis]|uniref:hypothetical protein n=1 Tax=Gordonia TaxID=2053 RepID=UPI0024181167|nr:hypothetical protein [Gordonia sihwensis]WFN93488.1 hypothetical protein P5P27_02630 [Gordonia sihwensis]
MTINDVHRTMTRRGRAFWVGVGSLIDLRGQATYEAMQDLLPDPELKPVGVIYAETNRLMSQTPTSIESLHLSLRR